MRLVKVLMVLALAAGLLPWCGMTSAWAEMVGAGAEAAQAGSAPDAKIGPDARADKILKRTPSQKQPRLASQSSVQCAGGAALVPTGFVLAPTTPEAVLCPDRGAAAPGLTRAPPRFPPRLS